jgi:phage terminase Nu1 subunit (DNA packaging protein)
MLTTFLGMQIDRKGQHSKHDPSIRASRDWLSNAIALSVERRKQDLPRLSTDRGMQIDFNEQCWKHDSSICDN